MAVFGGDSWLSDHDACVRLGQTIMELVNERDRLQRAGSNHSKINADIRSNIRRYQQDVQLLDQKLKKASNSYHLTQREAERRRALVENLYAKEKTMNESFRKDIMYTAPERTSLLPSTSGFGQDGWGGVSEDTRNLSINELQQEQQRLIQEQDDGLDELSAIISKQKRMGQLIGQEVDEHIGKAIRFINACSIQFNSVQFIWHKK
ncbi:syntaxin-8-like isoform X1 [Diadema antillarum]|uniref:syntaxin-8-like n=2 Tax=Diadema antillarum TaxID=105358 RepID=UPI003A862A4D